MFVTNMGLKSSDAISILCRRTAIFMLGLSVLLFISRNLPDSTARNYISCSTGITMLGLACMGSYELIKGTVNSSMLVAISIETVLGVSFILTLVYSKKQMNSNG